MVAGGQRAARRLLLLLAMIFIQSHAFPQEEVYSRFFYRVYLADKGGADQEEIIPDQLLSERSLARRARNGVTLDYTDARVHQPYIDSLLSAGLRTHCRSKWMNSLVVSSKIPIDLELISEISFVDSIILVRPSLAGKTVSGTGKWNDEVSVLSSAGALPYYWQLQMNRGEWLHGGGFRGSGVLIAVLDGGFDELPFLESLEKLFLEERISYTWDYVLGVENVYDHSKHGSSVLSILAGDLPGRLEGSAPASTYMLFRTEDVDSEYLVEEDFWVAAAEFADSAGADIITTSLGYSTFDDDAMDYSYSDMDGKTTFVSRGADMASSKGILVFSSAGNQRDDPWQYITAPADANEVISVGAVKSSSKVSDFSSAGPSADGRVKPDVMAMGVEVTIQNTPGITATGKGTSFACPIISGLAACLYGALPQATAKELREAIIMTSDRYMYPDTLYGYGIANFRNAYVYLYENRVTERTIIKLYPNPTTGQLWFRTNERSDSYSLRIYTTMGVLVLSSQLENIASPALAIPGFEKLAPGTYILELKSGNKTWREKIIKIKRL